MGNQKVYLTNKPVAFLQDHLIFFFSCRMAALDIVIFALLMAIGHLTDTGSTACCLQWCCPGLAAPKTGIEKGD